MNIPTAPDGGALAYVLRTGFGSSQGSLLQMIEFSQQTVAGNFRVFIFFVDTAVIEKKLIFVYLLFYNIFMIF